MASRREKIEAGLFLLIAAGLLFTVLFLLLGQHLTKETDSYKVVFTESVGNLKAQSPVNFMGYPIGNVERISLSDDLSSIEVWLALEKGTPITSKVTAQLQFNPLTSVYFIELSREGEGGRPLDPGDEIVPRPSKVEEIINSLPEIQKNLSNLMNQLYELFSDRNLETFRQILLHVDETVASLPRNIAVVEKEAVALRKDVKATLEIFNATLQVVSREVEDFSDVASREVENLSGDARKGMAVGMKEMEQAAVGLSEAMTRLADRADELLVKLKETSEKMDEVILTTGDVVSEGGVGMMELMRGLDETMRELRTTLKDFRRDPSRVIWSRKMPERKTPDEAP